jgi:hypothetical protein
MHTRVLGPGCRGWLVENLRDGVWWETWGDGYRVSVWSLGVLIEAIELD